MFKWENLLAEVTHNPKTLSLPQNFKYATHWEFNELESFLNRSFSADHYLKSYPYLDQPQNWRIVENQDNKIVGSLCIHSFIWQQKEKIFRGSCFGSIATSAECRNKGIASALIQDALKECAYKRSDFVFLFSENISFYKKFGFDFWNDDHLISLKDPYLKKRLRELNHRKFREENSEYRIVVKLTQDLQSLESAAIWRFIVNYSTSLENYIDFYSFSKSMKTNNMYIYILYHKSDIASLVFFEKGIDLKNIFHGCVSKTSEETILLLKTCLHIKSQKENVFWLLSPSQKLLLEKSRSIKIQNQLIYSYEKFQNLKVKNSLISRFFVRSIQSC